MPRFLWLVGAAPVIFVVGVVLRNVAGALLLVKEPFFFVAILGAPAALVVGIVGSTVVLLRRPLARP